MTLSQLRTFALVARLGSVGAAAKSLGVSEPAVSAAVAALRREFGDELYVRDGAGIAFTPGGRRLAALAGEITALVGRARREVPGVPPTGSDLRIAAVGAVAEYLVPGLLEVFARRMPQVRVAVDVTAADRLADAVRGGGADVALGPRPGPQWRDLDAVPFLRYRLRVVAGADHPLARRRGTVPFALVAREPWFTGPGGLHADTPTSRWLARQRGSPSASHTCDDWRAAVAEVRAGHGVALVATHTVRHELRHGLLVALDVPGTPVEGTWWAVSLGAESLAPAARAFLRFVTSPDAVQAVLAHPGENSTRRPATVYTTLWS